jgi:hypothetical protein
MSALWVPGMPAGPLEEFVQRLTRKIDEFCSRRGHEQATVEVELVDGARYVLHSISAEPGFGFVTLAPYPEDEQQPWPRAPGQDAMPPDEVIVPVGSIRRITLDDAARRKPPLGFVQPGDS